MAKKLIRFFIILAFTLNRNIQKFIMQGKALALMLNLKSKKPKSWIYSIVSSSSAICSRMII